MSRLERIVAACGGVLLDNGTRALIPGPGHSPRDRSVSLVETEEGRVLIHCFSPKDDWRVVRRALAMKGLLDERAPETEAAPWAAGSKFVLQPASEDRVARASRIWSESRPISRTPASLYLRSRAIPETAWGAETLRFHAGMTSLDDRLRRPALIAALSDSSGVLQGVQVTLLTADGAAKAAVATPRRIIGRLIGGAVRLHAVDDVLVVAEGVETSLSAATFLGHPAWALLTADNLSRFIPPVQIQRLIIARDNDTAGQEAARRLCQRLSSQFNVSVQAPQGSNDWNEFACAQAAQS